MDRYLSIIFLAAVAYAIYSALKANKEENSEVREIKGLPPSVQAAVSSMDESTRNVFFAEYERRKKSIAVSYVAWILLGWHYLYNGKIGMQFAFWFTLGGFGIWWLVDLFRIPAIVRSSREANARQAILTLSAGANFKSHS